MQVLLLVSLLLGVSFVSTTSVKPFDAEEEALAIIECVRKALDGGLEAAELPDHNPLKVWRNISFPIALESIEGVVDLHNVEVSGIVDFLVLNVNGTYHEDIEEIDYDYQFHHHHMVASGDFDFDGTIANETAQRQGNFSLSLNHLNLTGIWYQGTNPNDLKNFTLLLDPEEAAFVLTGLDDQIDSVLSSSVTELLTNFFHSDDRFAMFADFAAQLQQRINDMWIDPAHNYRIDAILENCRTERRK